MSQVPLEREKGVTISNEVGTVGTNKRLSLHIRTQCPPGDPQEISARSGDSCITMTGELALQEKLVKAAECLYFLLFQAGNCEEEPCVHFRKTEFTQ